MNKKQANTCIWMEAGVLEYQLCPLHYNCDQCEIHQRLTHPRKVAEGKSPEHSLVSMSLPANTDTVFEAGYQYLPGYLWVRRISKGRIRMGLNPYLWQILPMLEKTLIARETREIHSGACLCWLHFAGGMICVRSPIAGVVCNRNTDLDGDVLNPLNLHFSSGYDNWLVDLELLEGDLERYDWLTRQQLLDQVSYHTRYLKRVAARPALNKALRADQPQQNRLLKKLITPKPIFMRLMKNLTDRLAFAC